MPRASLPPDAARAARIALRAERTRALLARVTPVTLRARLAEQIASIPEGTFTTFGALARDLGSRSAAMWVARTVRDPAWEPTLPKHRVLAATAVTRSGPESVSAEPGPLMELVAEQTWLSTELREMDGAGADDEPLPEVLLAFDVSYGSRLDRGVAACIAWDTRQGKPIWSATAEAGGVIPYIPTFLAWRELPPLLKVAELAIEAGWQDAPAFVDGAGSMHPLGLGVATHLGLVTGLRTAGVAKSILCGRVNPRQLVAERFPAVVLEDRVIAALVEMRPGGHVAAVSGGLGTSVAQAARWVGALADGKRLIPPIREADRLSRAVARQG